MTSHLIEIHIGPVQDFIAAARRSRDLWFGSWLLSELSKAVAKAIADEAGKEALIFPAPEDANKLSPDTSLNVANKVVALVENPKKCAEHAKSALHNRLREITQATFPDALQKKVNTWETARTQIEDMPEFYWVSVPVESYAKARNLADSLLAARKNSRDFAAVTWGSNRPKSSLDGARESVIPKNDSPNADVMYRRYRAKVGEQLSGVDLLKRLGKEGDGTHFPSSSHMAALLLANQLADNARVQQAWQVYFNQLPNEVRRQERIKHELELPNLGDADGSLLFESRLLDYFDKPQRGQNGRSPFNRAKKALQTFYTTTGIEQPGRYYALLMGDGDYVGQTINTLTTPQAHRRFSQALAQFAEAAKEIVAEHRGAVIYAGGDDVMALLPLHKALQCCQKISQTFLQMMSEYTNSDDKSPTFSAGLAIVHHLEPLEDALNLARAAEKRAKLLPEKNALAVALNKRSGAPRIVVGKWALAERLLTFAALHQMEMIPDRLAYQLRDVYLELGGDAAIQDDLQLKEVIALESTRIIGRKRTADGQSEMSETSQSFIQDAISNQATTVESVANEIVIASELAKACTLANLELLLTIETEVAA